jgi:hypothetical protein
VLLLVLGTSRAHADTWELKVAERLELVAGTSGTLPLALAVDRGLVVSKDAPVILDLAPDAALSVKKKRLGRSDAVDPDADAPRFQIAVHADTAGDYAMKLRVRFWLCGGKVCRPIDARRTVTVTVATPAP